MVAVAANASHELRTPLAVTQTLLDVGPQGSEPVTCHGLFLHVPSR
jgi:signal transduction histidine kinase